MSERRRLDESLSYDSMEKALTGQGAATIDLNKIEISPSGNIIPIQQIQETSISQGHTTTQLSNSSSSHNSQG